MSNHQKTIKRSVSCSGIGLHTGVESTVVFNPSSENSGINFVRTDVPDSTPIPADVNWVVSSVRGTTIGRDGLNILTIEHILSAVYGLGIDNITIELSAKEPPAMDGSAIHFVEILRQAGIVDQVALKDYIVIQEPLTYANPNFEIEMNIVPQDNFMISCSIDYGIAPLGKQEFTISSMKDFPEMIAPARTFCLLSEVEDLLSIGLAKGGSLKNTIVFLDTEIEQVDFKLLQENFGISKEIMTRSNGILNREKLRFENEPVRHKALDIIGDFALLGKSIKGHVMAKKPSHTMNVEMVKRIKEIYC